MKRIVPIVGVLLCLMFIVAATPYARSPRVAIELERMVFPRGLTWGVVQLRFPLGSLTISPSVGINKYGLSNTYVGIGTMTSTRLLQLETAYVFVQTGVWLKLFHNWIDSARANIGAGVGWSLSPFLDIIAAADSSVKLKNSYQTPFRLFVVVQISWPLF